MNSELEVQQDMGFVFSHGVFPFHFMKKKHHKVRENWGSLLVPRLPAFWLWFNQFNQPSPWGDMRYLLECHPYPHTRNLSLSVIATSGSEKFDKSAYELRLRDMKRRKFHNTTCHLSMCCFMLFLSVFSSLVLLLFPNKKVRAESTVHYLWRSIMFQSKSSRKAQYLGQLYLHSFSQPHRTVEPYWKGIRQFKFTSSISFLSSKCIKLYQLIIR